MNLIAHYIPYVKRHRRPFILGLVTAVIAGAASGVGVPFFIQVVFRKIFDQQEAGYSLAYLLGVASLLPAAFLVRGVALYFNQFFISDCFLRVLRDLRRDLFTKLQRLSLDYYERKTSGELLSRLLADTTQTQQALMAIGHEGIRAPLTVFFGLGYIVYLSIQQKEMLFVLLLLGLIPASIAIVRKVGKHLRRRGRQTQAALGQLTNLLAENLRGVMEIRAFNLERLQEERFAEATQTHYAFERKVIKYDKLTQPLMEVLSVVGVSVAFVYAYRVGLSFDTFASLGAALYFTGDAAKRMARTLNVVQRTEGAVERVDQILREPEPVRDAAGAGVSPPARGVVSFEGVHFAYEDRVVFQGLTLRVPPGQICALVGPSGAGKTTFVKLIPRFYDVQQGQVKVDGEDVRAYTLAELRKRISLVPQVPVLFNDTVANNIRLGRPGATDAEVEAAARAAQADEFIRLLPRGYATEVGENAVRLSGGQRQRLALARAFLKDAPILVLDEATSALDSESEAKIQAALEELVKGKTVFIVAHRFSTIKLAHRVLVFEQGRIVGDGSHEELLGSVALYRDLYELQR